jgi:hypothetical protein
MAQATEDTHRRGLSCAIGTQEAEDLTLIHIKTKPVVSNEIPEFLDQIPDFYDLALSIHDVPSLGR